MAEQKLSFIKIKKYLWPASKTRRVLTSFLAITLIFIGINFGVAQWYINKHKNEPLTIGTTFISNYAESFGLDPKETLGAILGDLNIKQIRLVSYWDQIEFDKGTYNFSNLDWQFAMANQYGAKVSLAIGLRQPRWPECHQPSWVNYEPKAQRESQLYKYMQAVVDRYKNNPALEGYELENEFFMKIFGICTDFDRSRLVAEFNMVKQWDPYHKIIVSRSNNWIGIPVGQPVPDEFGISIYKRVWDKTITHRYFEYPLPAWFYSSLVGWEELVSGKNTIIHELQTEPWPPTDIHLASLEEQYKSMGPERLKDRIEYGKATGMKTIDLWGAEWFYWVKVKQNDPRIWNIVKQAVAQAEIDNAKLPKN